MGRKYNFDTQNFIVGDNAVAQALRTSAARDWGLSGDFGYMELVQRVAEETEVTYCDCHDFFI